VTALNTKPMTIQVHRSASGCFVSISVRIVDPAMRELALLDASSASVGVSLLFHSLVQTAVTQGTSLTTIPADG
jgi:hypothetical protein